MDRTAVFTTSNTAEDGSVAAANGAWVFEYDKSQTPLQSSERKQIFTGAFTAGRQDEPVQARALAYGNGYMREFGMECATLGLLTSLGVGPRLLAITQANIGVGATTRPIIIEADVGENLAGLITGVGADGARGVLHETCTRERDIENSKILHDIFTQVINAHGGSVYHRDLRCENVCVRRFGPMPEDIKATLIDFELGAGLDGGEPRARARLYSTLFTAIPSLLAGAHMTINPNPFELDMGYLAALHYHLTRNVLALNAEMPTESALYDFLEFLEHEVDYFGYPPQITPPRARRLDADRDVRGFAERSNLFPLKADMFKTMQLFEYARTLNRFYLDREDMKMCNGSPAARLAEMIDEIAHAKFETYKELRRKQGKEVFYETLEEQPKDFQESNYAQAEHIPMKVESLGYLIAPMEDSAPEDVIDEFTDEQIELLARLEHDRFVEERLAKGWKLDRNAERSDPDRRISPYLVGWEEIEDDVREYDRDAARQVIPLLRRAGLAVVRQR